MNISGLLSRFFGRETEVSTSKNTAKERLRLVLVHDRLDISEGVMEQLREDLIATIGRYMDIDRDALDVSLSREDDGVALVANIPVKGVKRGGEAEDVPTAPVSAVKPAAPTVKPAAPQAAPKPAAPTVKPAAPQAAPKPAAPDPARAMMQAAQSAQSAAQTKPQ